jgi:glyoxylase-like metal-dependent hydrolase (beta-lactamase superfamily II)
LGNHEKLLEGIANKLFVLDDDILVYPGHGEPTTIGYEKLNNPFFQSY